MSNQAAEVAMPEGNRTIILMPVFRVAKFWNAVAASFYKLDPQPERYVFCENGSPDDTLELISRFKRKKEVIEYVSELETKPDDTPYDTIGKVRQILLERARELDPDHALFLDADIRVRSLDLIDEITGWPGADIVGGPYLREYPQAMAIATIWPHPSGKGFLQLPFLPQSNNPLVEAVGTGGGCLCLSRKIIQDKRLNFFPVKGDDLEYQASEDFAYCLRARKLGYRVFVDSGIKLDHWVTVDHIRAKAWNVEKVGDKHGL